jgi:uncharacterized protein YlxW (UPF0749 family)
MDKLEKTLKIRAYSEEGVDFDVQGDNLKHEQELSYELASKNAQLAEEKNKSLEHLKTIVQLRESHKQEQAKVAEMANKVADLEAKIKALSRLETGELAQKDAQLEKEKNKSIELAKTIEQQNEKLDEAQKKVTDLEMKVKDMADLLDKISRIAATAKAG